MKKVKGLLAMGLVILAIGAAISFFNTDPQEENFRIARNSKDAYEAAQLIARNNQIDMFLHMASMFCFGLGGTITALSVFMLVSKKRR